MIKTDKQTLRRLAKKATKKQSLRHSTSGIRH